MICEEKGGILSFFVLYFFLEKNNENPPKETKPSQQSVASSAPVGRSSGQTRQLGRPSPQQSGAPVAAGRSVEPSVRPGQEDEWKSSQRTLLQLERSQENRSVQLPDERRPQPQTQDHRQRSDQQRQPHQQHGTWHQDRKPQPWRANKGQGFQGQSSRQQPAKRQEGAWSLPPPSQAIRSNKPQASSSSDKTPKRRPEPLTMEDVQKQGISPLFIDYKGEGTSGQPLGEIETNFVRLTIAQIPDHIFHYDVSFEPERPKKFLAKVFKRFVETNYPKKNVYVAFDGAKNAYASQQLEITDLQKGVKIIHPETGKELNFKVTIQEAKNNRIPFGHVLRK